jgi:hypothetical protein
MVCAIHPAALVCFMLGQKVSPRDALKTCTIAKLLKSIHGTASYELNQCFTHPPCILRLGLSSRIGGCFMLPRLRSAPRRRTPVVTAV